MGYCRNCGSELLDQADYCIKCGVAKGGGNSFCPNCGATTIAEQAVCVKCGVSLGTTSKSSFGNISRNKSKFVRVRNGKLLGGVFSGAEKSFGINRWLGRIIALFIPLWPIWLIAYIIVCTQTEMVDN